MTLRVRFAVLVGVVFLSVVAVRVASAAPDPYSSFSIRPVSGTAGYFIFEGKRGGRLTGSFRIVNTGTEVGTARLSAVDATTGATSGAVYLDRVAKRRFLGRWVALPVERVTLSPGEARIVSFSVRVPRWSRAGHHLGGIVAENLQLTGQETPDSTRAGLAIKVRHLSIVAVQVNLPGRRIPAVSFDGVKVGVTGGYEVLYLAFRNPGNVLLKPKLAVQVKNSRGRIVVRQTQKLDTLVPKTRIPYPLYLTRKPLAAGTYRLSGTLSYAKRLTRFKATFVISPAHVRQLPRATRPEPVGADSRASTSVLPWALAGGALLAGILLGGVIVALRPSVGR